MKLVTTKFKSGGLHEKHVVATWNVGNHLLFLKIRLYMKHLAHGTELDV